MQVMPFPVKISLLVVHLNTKIMNLNATIDTIMTRKLVTVKPHDNIEKAEHRIDHLIRLRDLQDDTGGFQTFIPLAFHPDNTELDAIQKPDGMRDLRTIAVSRLMLDNFDHIKAYWIMLGEQTAQLALSYGADDIDGTVVHELIYHDAGATTPEGKTVEQLHQLIRETGRDPVERDTLYRKVLREGATWSAGAPITA